MKPIKLPNCQFKIFRENTLNSNRTRETHARDLQENKNPQIRRIKEDVIKAKKRPVKQILKPIVKFHPNAPNEPDDVVPNCEIMRQISR